MDRTLDRRAFDRRLFAVAAIAFPLIVLAGFARTYYLKPLFDVPPLPSAIVHAHGLLMTAWVVLFIAQIRFVAARRIRLHQQLGYAGVALAVLIIFVGFITALRAARFGSASTPPGVSPLGFLIVPLFDLLMFAIFFGAAIYYRKKPAIHKRLILLTAINFVPPAVARIPIASLQAFGPVWFFGFPTLLLLVCIGVDTWRNRQVNGVLVTGALLLVASYVARLALMPTGVWLHIAARLTSMV